jgi:hypothetical protein
MVEREGLGLMAMVAAVFVALSLVMTVVVIDGAEYQERYPIQVGDTMAYSSGHTDDNGTTTDYFVYYHVTFVNETTVLMEGSSPERPNGFFGMVFHRGEWSIADYENQYLQDFRIETLDTSMGLRTVRHYSYLVDSVQSDIYQGENGIMYKMSTKVGDSSSVHELVSSDIEWV